MAAIRDAGQRIDARDALEVLLLALQRAQLARSCRRSRRERRCGRRASAARSAAGARASSAGRTAASRRSRSTPASNARVEQVLGGDRDQRCAAQRVGERAATASSVSGLATLNDGELTRRSWVETRGSSSDNVSTSVQSQRAATPRAPAADRGDDHGGGHLVLASEIVVRVIGLMGRARSRTRRTALPRGVISPHERTAAADPRSTRVSRTRAPGPGSSVSGDAHARASVQGMCHPLKLHARTSCARADDQRVTRARACVTYETPARAHAHVERSRSTQRVTADAHRSIAWPSASSVAPLIASANVGCAWIVYDE